MHVARQLITDPRVVPGGGASEMAIGQALVKHAKSIKTIEQRYTDTKKKGHKRTILPE